MLASSGVIAMTLTGHRPRAVFERYNITTSADREQVVAKLAQMGQGDNRGTNHALPIDRSNQQETA